MRDDPLRLLRQNGLQVTAQRSAVLRAIRVRSHSTVDRIVGDLRAGIGTISRQGFHDTLPPPTEKGLTRRTQPAGLAALYDPRVGDNHHHGVSGRPGGSDLPGHLPRVPGKEPGDREQTTDRTRMGY